MEPSERLLDQIPQLVSYATVIKAIWTASRLTEHVRKQDGYGRVIKPDSSPVTVADLAAQMTVLDGIQSAFLGESVIAEEDSTSLTDEDIIAEVTRILDLFGVEFNNFDGLEGEDKTTFWTIDPIDGTKGFLRNGQYAVCVARVQNAKIKLSFVACPNLECSIDKASGTLFVAIAGEGCWEVSLASGDAKLLPKRKDELTGSVMAESYEPAHTSHELSSGLRSAFGMNPEPLQLDSQVKYGLLARGQASIYLRKPKEGYREKIWDHAPGWLLVAEAGGQLTDFDNQPIVFSHGQYLDLSRGLVATMYTAEDHVKIVEYLRNT